MWAASIITTVFLLIILLPTILLTDSLVEGIGQLRESYRSGQLDIPPPSEQQIKNWPSVAKPALEAWQLASENLGEATLKFAPQIKEASSWILTAIAGTGVGIMQFVFSIIIAGVFLVYSEEGERTLRGIFIKLAGDQGNHFAELSGVTIRNVVRGVLGVAIIQTILASIGFVVAGVPLAGLWTLLCLILAIVQIGVGPIVIGVSIYMFFASDTLTASLLAAWTVVVTLSDNVLKPILLGRGAPVPMLVIFLGSVGGFIVHGFLGLFLGAIILSLGYKLFNQWVEQKAQESANDPAATKP